VTSRHSFDEVLRNQYTEFAESIYFGHCEQFTCMWSATALAMFVHEVDHHGCDVPTVELDAQAFIY
jgi:hypothetical protein